MEKKIIIFSVVIIVAIALILLILPPPAEQTPEIPLVYPQTLSSLSDSEVSALMSEFKTLNAGQICNSLDIFGFVAASCTPSEILRVPITDSEPLLAMAGETLAKNYKFTGVSKSALVLADTREIPGCVKCDGSAGDMETISLRIDYTNQVYRGMEVEDTQISVFANSEKVYRIDGHWYPDIQVPEPVITEDDARNSLIGKEVGYSDIAGKPHTRTLTKDDVQMKGELVILPLKAESKVEIRLAWRIIVAQGATWTIHVDAVTGEVLRERANFVS